MKKSVVLSLSGGMDSAALLYLCLRNCDRVHAVTFSYGSKHNAIENTMARQLVQHALCNMPNGARCTKLTHQFITLDFVQVGITSDLLTNGGPIPEGHYEDENMTKTVVPGRNTIFTSYLVGIAASLKYTGVALGIHAGDHAIYPDCRPKWFKAMARTVRQATEKKVKLLAPFLNVHKADIVAYGLEHGTPFSLTRTCYTDREIACGLCGSCTERLEAFFKNKAADPLDYQTVPSQYILKKAVHQSA